MLIITWYHKHVFRINKLEIQWFLSEGIDGNLVLKIIEKVRKNHVCLHYLVDGWRWSGYFVYD